MRVVVTGDGFGGISGAAGARRWWRRSLTHCDGTVRPGLVRELDSHLQCDDRPRKDGRPRVMAAISGYLLSLPPPLTSVSSSPRQTNTKANTKTNTNTNTKTRVMAAISGYLLSLPPPLTSVSSSPRQTNTKAKTNKNTNTSPQCDQVKLKSCAFAGVDQYSPSLEGREGDNQLCGSAAGDNGLLRLTLTIGHLPRLLTLHYCCAIHP